MIRDGYVRLQFIDGGGYNLAVREYDQVLTAWREGARWYEGRDPYGSTVTIALDGLRYVERVPAEALAASREEDRLDKLEGVR